MFKSKRRPIVAPQSEHLKLVGTLAMLWGNHEFDLPPIERESMILGMGTHDRGYGYLDNHPIGGMTNTEWLPIAHRTFYMPCSDVAADTIVKYHFRRLARNDDSPQRKALTVEFSKAIDEHLKRHHLSGELFERIDRITNLCDSLSFSFCFDVPASGQISIFPRNGKDTEISVKYHVEEGVLSADPWPFSVDSYKGYILAYQSDNYPKTLDALVLPFMLKK
jgi:hypothetical protein